MNMLWWIVCGAAGLWIGMPNPVASVPVAALLYPASLFLLGTASTSWKQAFRLGWICGLAGSSACLYWLAIPVHDFGGLPWALAAPCPLFMGAYVGLYGGLFAALAHVLRAEPAWRKSLALGLGWYLLECFRGWFLTGFPWLTLASVPFSYAFAMARTSSPVSPSSLNCVSHGFISFTNVPGFPMYPENAGRPPLRPPLRALSS